MLKSLKTAFVDRFGRDRRGSLTSFITLRPPLSEDNNCAEYQ